MNYLLDTHTHTIVSGHAYSTMETMIESAAKKGLKIIGITEHAPQMPGTCHEFYFANLHVVQREVLEAKYGIKVLLGSELNIMNEKGEIDLPEYILKSLDVLVASIHLPCYHAENTVKNNTAAVIHTLENPYVDIIGHPDDGRFPMEYEPIVKAAKENNKLLEMNNSSLTLSYRENAENNYRTMLALCEKYQQPIVVNSDAHFYTYVGETTRAQEILNEIHFPKELIMNNYPEKFLNYTQKSKK